MRIPAERECRVTLPPWLARELSDHLEDLPASPAALVIELGAGAGALRCDNTQASMPVLP